MVKPSVALLYSEPRPSSEESKLMASYLGALLFHGGYSAVRLVCVPSEDRGKKEKVDKLDEPVEISEVSIAAEAKSVRTVKVRKV